MGPAIAQTTAGPTMARASWWKARTRPFQPPGERLDRLL